MTDPNRTDGLVYLETKIVDNRGNPWEVRVKRDESMDVAVAFCHGLVCEVQEWPIFGASFGGLPFVRYIPLSQYTALERELDTTRDALAMLKKDAI